MARPSASVCCEQLCRDHTAMAPSRVRRSAGRSVRCCSSAAAAGMAKRAVIVVTSVVLLASVGPLAAEGSDLSLRKSLLMSRTSPVSDQPLQDADQSQPSGQDGRSRGARTTVLGGPASPDPSPPTLDWSRGTATATEGPGTTSPSPGGNTHDAPEGPSPSPPGWPFSSTPEGSSASPPEGRPPSPPAGRVYDVQVQTSPLEEPRPDAVSLAFVFDSTGSMYRDLEQLKRGAAAILATMLARPDKPIHDYIFVPFNDPGKRGCGKSSRYDLLAITLAHY